MGQGGVRREVAEKDRRRTKGYEVVVDRGRGETGVGHKGIDEKSVEGIAAEAVGWCTKVALARVKEFREKGLV